MRAAGVELFRQRESRRQRSLLQPMERPRKRKNTRQGLLEKRKMQAHQRVTSLRARAPPPADACCGVDRGGPCGVRRCGRQREQRVCGRGSGRTGHPPQLGCVSVPATALGSVCARSAATPRKSLTLVFGRLAWPPRNLPGQLLRVELRGRSSWRRCLRVYVLRDGVDNAMLVGRGA